MTILDIPWDKYKNPLWTLSLRWLTVSFLNAKRSLLIIPITEYELRISYEMTGWMWQVWCHVPSRVWWYNSCLHTRAQRRSSQPSLARALCSFTRSSRHSSLRRTLPLWVYFTSYTLLSGREAPLQITIVLERKHLVVAQVYELTFRTTVMQKYRCYRKIMYY